MKQNCWQSWKIFAFIVAHIISALSINPISWASTLREVKFLTLQCSVSFQQVGRTANRMADSLAKQQVDHLCNLSALIMLLGLA